MYEKKLDETLLSSKVQGTLPRITENPKPNLRSVT
jgi:hypothetical protein